MRAPLIVIGLIVLIVIAYLVLVSSAEGKNEDRMREHIEWITANSDLEYNGEPLPALLPENERGLQLMFYGAQAVLDADASDNTTLMTLDAVYNHHDDVIFYRDDTPAERMDLMLVHELVHYLQDINDIMANADCPAETERQAYRIQTAWQDAHDDPNDRPDPFTVLLLSMCARDF